MNNQWSTSSPRDADRRFLSSSETIAADTATAEYMARVYRWMTSGLAVTGVTAVGVASNEALFAAVLPFLRPLVFVQLGVVFGLSLFAHRLSGGVAALLFIGYAALTGLTFSTLLYAYSLGSLTASFLVTAAAFGALSVYGTLTKRDLSAWRTFLFMGLVGILGASLVNLFMGSTLVSFVLSCAGILVFSGLTAYDTQKIRGMYRATGDGGTRSAVTGALVLYLDFINLFLSILRLFGQRR